MATSDPNSEKKRYKCECERKAKNKMLNILIWFVTFISNALFRKFQWLCFVRGESKRRNTYTQKMEIEIQLKLAKSHAFVCCLSQRNWWVWLKTFAYFGSKTIEIIFHPIVFALKSAQLNGEITLIRMIATNMCMCLCARAVIHFHFRWNFAPFRVLAVLMWRSATNMKTIRTAINNMKCHSHKFHLSKNFLSHIWACYLHSHNVYMTPLRYPPHTYSMYIYEQSKCLTQWTFISIW